MGCGMVVDIEHLCTEIKNLHASGIDVTPANLKISDAAFICLPYHKAQDILEEERLADKMYGSTRRGIAPVYGDKYMKKGLRLGDLWDLGSLEDKVIDIVTWKNLTLGAYGQNKANACEVLGWLREYGERLLPYITNTTEYLNQAASSGKKILFEAQLGALRDIDYGIYPYTTSSQTLAAYAPIGSGIPGVKLDKTVGVMKAYSSCVGEGPFVSEMFGDESIALREAGGEYGAATGRARRVGAFDVVASRYGVQVQGATEVALTKLDILAYLEKIPICIAYEIDGKRITEFPRGDALMRAKPVYEYMDGFKTDISKCRKLEDLPTKALEYIRYIESAVGCKITYVSVGASREDYLVID